MLIFIKFADKLIMFVFTGFNDIVSVGYDNFSNYKLLNNSNVFVTEENTQGSATVFDVSNNSYSSERFDLVITGKDSYKCTFQYFSGSFVNVSEGNNYHLCNSHEFQLLDVNAMQLPEVPQPIETPSSTIDVTPGTQTSTELIEHVKSIDSNIKALNISTLSINIVVLFVLILSILRGLFKR